MDYFVSIYGWKNLIINEAINLESLALALNRIRKEVFVETQHEIAILVQGYL